MKKAILISTLLICVTNFLFSQDLIVLKSGEEIKSKVLEISQTEIKYKKFDNLEGPTIAIAKSAVFMIKYQNGTKDVIKNDQSNPETKSNSTTSSLNSNPFRFGFYAEPLGIVQFGPHLGAEMTIANHLIIDGHVRFSSIGLLMRVITADDEEGMADKFSGMGIGGGVKYLTSSRTGGLYVGALVEYGWQTETYAEDETWVWESKQTYIVPMVSAGYKFRFPSGLYINTGANFGAARTIAASWHYLKNYKNDSLIHDDDLETHPFGMLEVALGIEF